MRRVGVALVLLVILAVSPATTRGATLVRPQTNTPQPLPSSPPGVSPAPRWRIPLAQPPYSRPALSGNTVVWADQACNTCKIALVLAQLSHPSPRTLIHLSPYVRLLDLHLSPHWLVWVQANYPTLGWRLRSLNLESGAERLLASSMVEGGPAAPGYPSLFLDGDQLVWVRHDCQDNCSRPGPSSLNVTDLATGATQRVLSTGDSCRPIGAGSLGDGTLSWVREPLAISGCRSSDSFTIVARDMRTGATTRRTIHLAQHQAADEFVGYGRRIAWVEHRQYTNEDSRVVLFDMQAGQSQIVARSGAYAPLLSERTLAWKGSYGATVEARDLVTGKHYLLARSYQTSGDAVSTGIWLGYSTGDRIVWEESHYDPNGSARREYLTVAQVP